MDLARAPRRTARKKGSGYENGKIMVVVVMIAVLVINGDGGNDGGDVGNSGGDGSSNLVPRFFLLRSSLEEILWSRLVTCLPDFER